MPGRLNRMPPHLNRDNTPIHVAPDFTTNSLTCRYIKGKVIVGHIDSSLSVYYMDECELTIALGVCVCACVSVSY